MNSLRILSSCLLFAALIPAQNRATFPSDHSPITDGAGSVSWHPYSYGVSRQMSLYETWDMTVPAGRTITRIGLRADGTRLSYGKSVMLEVRMGMSDRTADTMLREYDKNYIGTPITVFGPAVFNLPDLNNPLNPNPDREMIWLPLTTPFGWNPSANRNLIVEWRVSANNNGSKAFPYILDTAKFVSPIVTGPVGCVHSGGQIPTLKSRPTKIGTTWYCDLRQAPASQAAVMFLNVGIPLSSPYSLTPFLPGLAAACQGQVSIRNTLFSIPATTTATGSFLYRVPVPNDRVLNNLTVSSQAFCIDVFAQGGLVVSNGDQIEFGIEPAHALLYTQGSATKTTGTISRFTHPVTFFEYQ